MATNYTSQTNDVSTSDRNYRRLWGVIYAVVAIAIVAGAAMLFMRGRYATAPATPATSIESTQNTNAVAPANDMSTVPGQNTVPVENTAPSQNAVDPSR
jgi:hypothetical protein